MDNVNFTTEASSRDPISDALIEFLLSKPESKPEEQENRPAKRRKTAPSQWSEIPDEPEWTNPILLARMGIWVDFPASELPADIVAAFSTTPKPVRIFSDTSRRRRNETETYSGGDSRRGRRIRYDRKRSAVRLFVETENEELCEVHVPCEEHDRTYRMLKAVAFHICHYYPKRSSLRCPVNLHFVPSPPGLKIRLDIQLLSRDAKSLAEASFEELESKILGTLFPSDLHSVDEWVPQDFYDCVHVPLKDDKAAEEAAALEVVGLECRLYPFQRRSVRWLLDREGVDVHSRSQEKALQRSPRGDHGFVAVTSADDKKIYVNEWLGIVTSDPSLLRAVGTNCSGGLLAEEMGLGKTVEVVSLLLLHPRPAESLETTGRNTLVPTRATIIISPVSIQQQWKSEIEMHAPGLRVMIYEGLSGSKDDEEEHVAELVQYDVVLVSYNVLSKEVHYAMEGPDRALRHVKQYKKRRSPLVLIDWWRCVLDECQMIESGVSQAAQVANQIPRQNAWAVSGTPLKKDATDLYGLLTFLRLEPYCFSVTLWKRLISSYKPIFSNLFNHIALRHSKDGVKSELVLPPQKRVVMTLPFTSIEEQHYSNLFQEMCEDCDLSLEGAPLTDGWHPDRYIDKMRAWLSRLRQTVLHPEVGERNRKALGSSEGPLRTVAEVLRVMTEQNETATRAEERTYLTSKLRRGQILEHAKKTQDALAIWKDVLLQAQEIVDDCRKDRALIAGADETVNDEASQATNGESIKKEENEVLNARLGAWRLRLRGSLEVLHMATFFVANGYYQLKTNEEVTKSDSEEFKALEKDETDMYEEAKRIRKEMLTETLAKADEYMASIRSRRLVQVPECEGPSLRGGIESRNVMERADDLCVALNRQAEKMREWREAIIKFLLLPLIDQEDGELQGDEYETSTKQQDEVYVYMEALRAIEADRHDALTGQENILIKNEMRTNLRNAKNGEGHSPEVMIRLLQERDATKPKAMFGSFRSIVTELRSLRSNLERQGSTRYTTEMNIVDKALRELQQQFETQTKTMTELERELDLFMSSSNSRLDFYRQLQAISDGVAPFEEEFTDESRERKLSEMRVAEAKSKAKIETLESRARYLSHLHGENSAQQEAKTCVICQEPIEIGVLTSCGHQFCKDCLRQWWGAHRTCPVCKTKLNRSNFHQISYKPQELNVQEETGQRLPDGGLQEEADSPPESGTTSIYSGISSATFAQIKNIDVHGSFGTKIDTLARHILYLRQTDPGAKSIVFSQFRDFLDILGLAFRRFKISYASVDEQRKGNAAFSGIERFKRDTSVECFFLHAKAQAAGLNLVNATHVFLCEPLINTALELQAIARVHRIGQHRPTTVYMYLVDGTVERAIYDISVQRRLAHVGQVAAEEGVDYQSKKRKARKQEGDEDVDAELDAANSLELRAAAVTRMLAAGRGGGELVPKSDVWACLFQSRGAVRPQPQEESEEARKAVDRFLGGEAAEERRRQMVLGAGRK